MNLEKKWFGEFPFLLNHPIFEPSYNYLPKPLQLAVDSGNPRKGIQEYYGISTKKLQKVPFSTNDGIPSLAIIQMMKHKILKPEWLPEPPKNAASQFWKKNPSVAYTSFIKEQQSFCDVIGGCLRLSEHLGFQFNKMNPKSYPKFLIELIQNTASDKSKKSWREKAIALPFELRKNSSAHINIKDAIDDFIKTIFLPSYIQNNPKDYQGENAQQLFEKIHLEIVTGLLKGVPVGAIPKLSSHWHEPGRAAQLNKAKSFSSESWEPLFTSPLSYEYEGDTVTVTPLTTSEELTKEGDDLGHCVGGYTNGCLQGNSHIVSIRDEKGKSLSTIELKLRQGKGADDDPKIINIKGDNQYHLELIQHYGKNNSHPPSISKQAEKQFFLDLRSEKVKVDLHLLESKRIQRVHVLEKRGDIVLIGYDPLDKKSLNKAIKIYRTHGIGKIPYRKTLRTNFDVLTGKRKQVQAIRFKKNNNNTTTNDISNIQSFFDNHLGKDVIKVSVDRSKKKRFGEVLISLSDKSNISVEKLKLKLKDFSPKFGSITDVRDGIVKINDLTPKNVASIIKAK